MPGVPPPLPPPNNSPRWLFVILWLLPSLAILLMIPFGIYWMYATRGERVGLILTVFGVIQLALLSVLTEINSRMMAATPGTGERGPMAPKMLFGRFYFVIQFFLAPLFVFLVLSLLSWLGAR